MIKTLPVVVLSVALTLGSGGCSWIFVQPLPPGYQTGDPANCTSNVAAPVIDTIFTVLDTAELVALGGNSNAANRNSVLLGATLGIIIWGSSAIYGYRHTSDCSAAQADAVASYRPYRRVWGPPPAYPPPPPRPQLPPPGPPPPPAPPPEEAAPPPAPSVIVPSAPAAPQQRDDDGPG